VRATNGFAPKVAGFFAGIGGIELGLERAGFQTELLCENDLAAAGVLKKHFPEVKLKGDIRRLTALPRVSLVSAGFPCQDLSQAGRTLGIAGSKSGLVAHLFRLLRTNANPDWVLLENVPFMLQLGGGGAMAWLTEQFEALGYTWAYRTVDTRSFGLPQRRRRVLFLASQHHDPRTILFSDDAECPPQGHDATAFGFYWTEGNTGLGWAKNCVPTLKGGSGLGIPSPPGVWFPDTRQIGVPNICDGERLQGFPEDWTKVSIGSKTLTAGSRWKLVGNAVSVPVSEWVGTRLREPGIYDKLRQQRLSKSEKWPLSGYGRDGERFRVDISEFPKGEHFTPLREFLKYGLDPLSLRAAQGFLGRFQASTLRKDPMFIAALQDLVRQHQGSTVPELVTSKRMKSVRQKGTGAELTLVEALASSKLRFEQNTYAIEGVRTKPDVVFRRRKIAIYVDGCFWHSCPYHATKPRNNSMTWEAKLLQNVNRDRANCQALRDRGWRVIRFWSHEKPAEMLRKVKAALKAG